MLEAIKNIVARFWLSGSLFLVGFLLILYVSLGVLYLQQSAKQREFETQINKLGAVVARPMASGEELKAKYEQINLKLAPMEDIEAIALLVSIAEENGIDVSSEAGKFSVPSARFSKVRVDGGDYRVISFKNIHVQGDYDSVLNFISDIDSGETLETMVLTRVSMHEVSYRVSGDATRLAELHDIRAAVTRMMDDNDLTVIPNPISFAGGVATNLMGDDPDTLDIVEGFPDISTTALEKGYTGIEFPRNGYVLYAHDMVATDNTSLFTTVNYYSELETDYYYTCEADGTVRQFDGASLLTAKEHFDTEEYRIEYIAEIDVQIYTKPGEG